MIIPNINDPVVIDQSVNNVLEKRKNRVTEETASICGQHALISSEITSVGEIISWVPTTCDEIKAKRMKIDGAEQRKTKGEDAREALTSKQNLSSNLELIEETKLNYMDEEKVGEAKEADTIEGNLPNIQLDDAKSPNCKLFAIINRDISLLKNNPETRESFLSHVNALIEDGADINAVDAERKTPLFHAVQLDNTDLVKLLLKKGANPYHVDKKGKSSADYAMELENSELLDFLQQKVPDIIHPVRSKTLLHRAVIEGKNSEFIQILLKGPLVDEIDENRDTPLMLAIRMDQPEVALELSVQTRNIEQVNRAGRNVLHELISMNEKTRKACQELESAGESEQLAILRSKSKIWEDLYLSLSSKIGERALSAIRNKLNMSTIEKSFLPLDPGNPYLYLLGNEAINTCDVDTVRCVIDLLKRYKIDINQQDSSGMNLFMTACELGNDKVITYLVDIDISLTATNSMGNNGFHLLAGKGRYEALKHSLQKAFKIYDLNTVLALLNVKNNEGLTPVMCAAKGVFKECVDFLTSAGSEVTRGYLAAEAELLQKDFDDKKKTQRQVQSPQNSQASQRADQSNPSGSSNAAIAAQVPETKLSVSFSQAIQKILNRTPLELLYHACKFGLTEVVRDRLKNSALASLLNKKVEDVHHIMEKDKLTEKISIETALYVACRHGHTNIVKELLAHKADPNIPAINGWPPLFVAAKQGYFEIVKMLIANGAEVRAKNRNDMTPLNIAAYGGFCEIVQELINHGGDVNQGDKMGANPLHAAVQSNKVEMVKLLLDNGADINGKTLTDISALYVASYSGLEDIVDLFLNYTPPALHANTLRPADPNAMNKEGLTAVTVAAFNGHLGVVKRLIKAGADLTLTRKKMVTGLYAACQNGHKEVVTFLLERGADPRIPIGNGNTVVHAAAIDNHLEVLKILIDKKVPIDISNDDGVTPLYMACEKGRLGTVEMLIEFGADVNIRNRHTVSPLNIASQNGHTEVVKKLIASGANINSQVVDGPTPLFIAAQNGHVDVCKLLLTAEGILVDAQTKEKETALFVAAYFNHFEIVKLLIDAKASINIIDRDGRTPLWWACKAGRLDVVKLLIAAGADVNISDRQHVTPQKIAAENKHREVCELLNSTKSQPVLCSICLINPRTVAFLPCNHLASCADCTHNMEREAQKTKAVALNCPLCRTSVDEAKYFYC